MNEHAGQQCEATHWLPGPLTAESLIGCILDAGHDGEHRGVIVWTEDDLGRAR